MTRDEMHDLVMGVALVALAYAVYQHHKAAAATAAQISASDQAAIGTAISSAPADGPAISIPAPIAIDGGGAGGYTFDMNTLLQGAY